MIFRVDDNRRLYEVKTNIDEKKFIELQNRFGSIKYIYANEKELPKYYGNINPSRIFYKLDDNNNIVIDEERIIDNWKKKLPERLERYILLSYNNTKQMSDLADKNYYETILRAKGYNLDKLLIKMNVKYEEFNDLYKTIYDFISSGEIKDEDFKAFEQLGKAMLRVKWVQECKDELKKALDEIREPKWKERPI